MQEVKIFLDKMGREPQCKSIIKIPSEALKPKEKFTILTMYLFYDDHEIEKNKEKCSIIINS